MKKIPETITISGIQWSLLPHEEAHVDYAMGTIYYPMDGSSQYIATEIVGLIIDIMLHQGGTVLPGKKKINVPKDQFIACFKYLMSSFLKDNQIDWHGMSSNVLLLTENSKSGIIEIPSSTNISELDETFDKFEKSLKELDHDEAADDNFFSKLNETQQ